MFFFLKKDKYQRLPVAILFNEYIGLDCILHVRRMNSENCSLVLYVTCVKKMLYFYVRLQFGAFISLLLPLQFTEVWIYLQLCSVFRSQILGPSTRITCQWSTQSKDTLS